MCPQRCPHSAVLGQPVESGGSWSDCFRQGLAGPLALVVAILPALPIIGIFAAIGRYLVEERDEYLRLLRTREALVASGFALSIATAWGFLESVDLSPHIDAYWIAVIWFVGLGIGFCVNVVLATRQK